jgi:hypothetical protein
MKENISVSAYRENPAIVLDMINKFLDGSSTGTLQIELVHSQGEFLSEDYEKTRHDRAYLWLEQRWNGWLSFSDHVQLLLDFENYLKENQLELVPPPTEEENTTHLVWILRKSIPVDGCL